MESIGLAIIEDNMLTRENLMITINYSTWTIFMT